MTEDIYWIWFQILFGIGTRRAELMLNHFANPQAIYSALQDKSEMFTPAETAKYRSALARAEGIMKRTRKKGVSIVTPEHTDYPVLLDSIYAKPAVLYVKGDLSILHDRLAIATVGTREASDYGKAVAKVIAGGLAKAGAVVVSGLAPGIDTECHTAAIAAGGKSVGFLGCGIDVDYPKDSAKIKRLVCENGAVVTEYPLGTKPHGGNFPTRNRLLSGVSHGVIVIEADSKSGALITANHALEQGRDIFAVPGRISDSGSEGCNRLIADGAKLALTLRGILAEYAHLGVVVESGDAGFSIESTKPVEPASPTPQKRAAPDELSPEATKIYEMLGADSITVEQLTDSSDFNIAQVLSALTELEIYGLVQMLPGRKIQVQ